MLSVVQCKHTVVFWDYKFSISISIRPEPNRKTISTVTNQAIHQPTKQATADIYDHFIVYTMKNFLNKCNQLKRITNKLRQSQHDVFVQCDNDDDDDDRGRGCILADPRSSGMGEVIWLLWLDARNLRTPFYYDGILINDW